MDGNKIVVGMTTRGKDADKFWFSLFHELAHIVLGHITKTTGTSNEDENAADKWAADQLIDPDDLNRFKEQGDYSERSIIQFSHEQEIAPGIIVGRLQAEGLIKYNMFNNLKKKYEIVV